MTYLDDASIGKKCGTLTQFAPPSAPFDNEPLVVKILELRKEKARLLGFNDFADLVLEDRMAHTGAAAQGFLDALRVKTEARFREENVELEAFAKQELEPWDIAYWAEKQRAALCDFDEEALRPYFSLERVTSGMFVSSADCWSRRAGAWCSRMGPDRAFLRRVRREIQPVSRFVLHRLVPARKQARRRVDGRAHHRRSRKEQAASWFYLRQSGAPVDGKPALLTHREAETIFHEFGHLLHHLLSRVEVRSLAGTSVAWDFVELPSQIMENWCWERASLDLLARHWQTGEPIPEELFLKMKRAKTFRAANMQMRRLGLGTVDLMLHRQWDPSSDVLTYSREILA